MSEKSMSSWALLLGLEFILKMFKTITNAIRFLEYVAVVAIGMVC
jgi:hypothetical protein